MATPTTLSSETRLCLYSLLFSYSATGFYLTLFNVLNSEYLLMNCGSRRQVSSFYHNRYLNIHSANSVTGDTLFLLELSHNVTQLTANLPVNLFTSYTFLIFYNVFVEFTVQYCFHRFLYNIKAILHLQPMLEGSLARCRAVQNEGR